MSISALEENTLMEEVIFMAKRKKNIINVDL